jgi:hypothetical protein
MINYLLHSVLATVGRVQCPVSHRSYEPLYTHAVALLLNILSGRLELYSNLFSEGLLLWVTVVLLQRSVDSSSIHEELKALSSIN